MRETNLSQLMRHFEIKGADLAKYCAVSSSMISQWKNNIKPLSIGNPICGNIADYIFNLYDKNRDAHNDWLQKLFQSENIDINLIKNGKRLSGDLDIKKAFCRLIASVEHNSDLPCSQIITVGENYCFHGGDLDVIRKLRSELFQVNSVVYIILSGSGIETDENFTSEIISLANKAEELNIIFSGDKYNTSLSSFLYNNLSLLTSSNINFYFDDDIYHSFTFETVFAIPEKAFITVFDSGFDAYTFSVFKQDDCVLNAVSKIKEKIKKLKPVFIKNGLYNSGMFEGTFHRFTTDVKSYIKTKLSGFNPLFMSYKTFSDWVLKKYPNHNTWRIDRFSERKNAFENFIKNGGMYYEYNFLNLYQPVSEIARFVQTDDIFDEANPDESIIRDIIDGYINLLKKYPNNFYSSCHSSDNKFISHSGFLFTSADSFFCYDNDGNGFLSENKYIVKAACSSFSNAFQDDSATSSLTDYKDFESTTDMLSHFYDNYSSFKSKNKVNKLRAFPLNDLISGYYPTDIINGNNYINSKWFYKITAD